MLVSTALECLAVANIPLEAAGLVSRLRRCRHDSSLQFRSTARQRLGAALPARSGVVFVTVFHGQSDAIPNAFTVAGIGLILAERYEYAGLMLGLGAGSKFYPAAFVPLLAVTAFRRASWRRASRRRRRSALRR